MMLHGHVDQVEVDSDQIEAITENSQCHTTWEIADRLQISKSIKSLVKMENVSSTLWKKAYGLFDQPNTTWRYGKQIDFREKTGY